MWVIAVGAGIVRVTISRIAGIIIARAVIVTAVADIRIAVSI
jgi:hypothetical protein